MNRAHPLSRSFRLLPLVAAVLLGAPGFAQQVGNFGDVVTRLLSTIPTDGAVGVALDRSVALRFSFEIDESSVNAASVEVSAGGIPIPTEYSLSLSQRSVRVDFPFFLPDEETVQVTVNGDLLRDKAGNPVDADGDGAQGGTGVITFSTGSAVPPPVESGTGLITGFVFDENGAPLAGAMAFAEYYPGGGPPLNAPIAISGPDGYFEYETSEFTGSETFLLRILMSGRSEAIRVVGCLAHDSVTQACTSGVEFLAGSCRRVKDAKLQPVQAPVPVDSGTGGTLHDDSNAVTLDIPGGSLMQSSFIGVTVLAAADLLRDDLPPLVASTGTFVDIAGVSGQETNTPVTMRIPNIYGLPPGTRVPLGKVDHNTLEWVDLQEFEGPGDDFRGTVTPDGSEIEVLFDHFCSVCTGYCLPYPPPDTQPPPDDPDPDPDDGDCGNSIIGYREGHLWETVSMPTFREFGALFGLTLSYYSGGANPTAAITGVVDYDSTRPVERTIFEFQVEGASVVAQYGYTNDDRKPIANYIWNGVNGLGQLLPTGNYPYSIQVTSLNSDVPISIPDVFGGESTYQPGGNYPGLVPLIDEPVTGRVTLLNLRDSEYGAGWRIMQEDRLYFDPDGCILLVSGMSSSRRFMPDPNGTNVWVSPAGDFSMLIQNPANGTFVRRFMDGREDRFSATGRMTRSRSRYGHTTLFTRQGDLLTRVTSPTGYFYDLTYDGSDKLMRIDDSAGRSTLFTVDGSDDLVTIVDAVGSVRTFEYDALHLMEAQNGSRGERSEYDYSESRVVAARAYDVDGTTLLRERFFAPSVLDGEVSSNLAMGLGTFLDPIPIVDDRIDESTDGNGAVQLHESDASGRTIMLQDALGRQTTFTYNSDGLRASQVRPNGWSTQFEYDEGELTTFREYDNGVLHATWSQEWNGPFHRPSRKVDQEGKETLYFYDALGNIVTTQDHMGGQQTLVYGDPNFPQMPTVATAPGGARVEMTYDAHGNPATMNEFADPVAYPNGRTSVIAYDDRGNPQSVTDAEARTTTFEFNEWNRLVRRIEHDLSETLFSYDDQTCACGTADITEITLANGETLSYRHDGLGRLVEETDQFGLSKQYVYDPEGNLTQFTDRTGDTIQYAYDLHGQLIQRELPGHEITTYSYDTNGLLTAASDPACNLAFERDFLGDLKQARVRLDLEVGGVAIPYEHTIDITNDLVGNRTSLQDSTGVVDYTYTYDDLHRLSTLVDQLDTQRTWTFTYDPIGQISSIDRGVNAFTSTYAYNQAGAVTAISHATTPPIDLSFGAYDAAGDLTESSSQTGAQATTWTHEYDDLRRLRETENTGTAGEVQVDQTCVYDEANRLSSDGEFTYTYDEEGRMTTRTDVSSGVIDTFTWDALGQLRQFEQQVDVMGSPVNVMTATYCYDALGRRIMKDVNGVVTKYVHDQHALLLELDSQNRVIRSYTHGVRADHPLAFYDGVTDLRYYYVEDRLGSVIGLTDEVGNVVQTYAYDEFGTLLDESTPSLFQPFGYTGRERELESGLYNYRARYYDPQTGRFISEDPLGMEAGLNYFSYVLNNPVNGTDPSGLLSCPERCARDYNLALKAALAASIAGTALCYAGFAACIVFATPVAFPACWAGYAICLAGVSSAYGIAVYYAGEAYRNCLEDCKDDECAPPEFPQS